MSLWPYGETIPNYDNGGVVFDDDGKVEIKPEEVYFIKTNNGCGCYDPNENTIVYYKFDYTINDSSDNGSNLILSGPTPSYTGNSICNMALYHDYELQNFSTPTIPITGFTTISFWMYYSGHTSAVDFYVFELTSSLPVNPYDPPQPAYWHYLWYTFRLWDSFGSLRDFFWIYNGGSTGGDTFIGEYDKWKWYHVCIVMDYSKYGAAGYIYNYINGQLVHSNQPSLGDDIQTDNLNIYPYEGGVNNEHGTIIIDEFFIENRIWSSDEVLEYYNCSKKE